MGTPALVGAVRHRILHPRDHCGAVAVSPVEPGPADDLVVLDSHLARLAEGLAVHLSLSGRCTPTVAPHVQAIFAELKRLRRQAKKLHDGPVKTA